MLKLGLRGRRYSGYKRGIGDEAPSFESLITSGVNAGSVARSVFGPPNWLRDIARVGLPKCFVLDMVSQTVSSWTWLTRTHTSSTAAIPI